MVRRLLGRFGVAEALAEAGPTCREGWRVSRRVASLCWEILLGRFGAGTALAGAELLLEEFCEDSLLTGRLLSLL